MADHKTPLLKQVYYRNCPGCKIEMRNQTHDGIPYLEFFYIWIVCLCSFLPIQSLFPFLYFMIRDLHVAKQEQDIGFYAGFVGASYFFGRTLSAVAWGIIADKYGRKPVIFTSILSVVVFNTLFGLSSSYWMAITTRLVLGFLCGILGPAKAYATEICSKEHQALGISLVTSARAIALVIGPAIGGFLAQPAEQFPGVFSEDSIFGRFPYFLPCLVISSIAVVASILCFWLPETLHMHHDDNVESSEEADDLENETSVGTCYADDEKTVETPDNLLQNWPLMSAIILYCVFSLHDTGYAEIFSLWAVSDKKYGGLNFTSKDVGSVLAISGVGLLLYQLLLYPSIARFAGPIQPFRLSAVFSIFLLAAYPLMTNMSGLALIFTVNFASLLKNIFSATITVACNILMNTSVTQAQRGVANGISVTGMSICKSIAPACAGIVFSWAQKHQTGSFLPGDQMVFFLLNVVLILGFLLTFKPFFALPSSMHR